jgi:hypothetical protein
MTTTRNRLPAESMSTLRAYAENALRIHAVAPTTFHDTFQEATAALFEAAAARGITTVAGLLAHADAVVSAACGSA